MTAKTVSLVLGSGGARGLAHIGVIRYLEENGYRIQSVSGCSMGALVGGIYCCNKLPEFVDWIRPLTKLDIVKLLDVVVGEAGLVQGDRVIGALKQLVGDRLIEELPVRFTAITADIIEEKEIWLDSGPLFDAIRASISLPLFFTPVERDGMKLLDGGILNPVPIAPTFRDGTDITVAVNLGGALEPVSEPVAAPDKPAEDSPVHERISRFVDELKDKYAPKPASNWDMFNIADKTFDTMQGAIARQKLAAYPPDRVITIARNACGTLEFDRADEMIELGYRKAREQFGD